MSRGVIDDLKAGVLQADWFDPELNRKPEEFAPHLVNFPGSASACRAICSRRVLPPPFGSELCILHLTSPWLGAEDGLQYSPRFHPLFSPHWMRL